MVGLWWGERLEEYAVLEAGDFAYIPSDLPHVVGKVGSEPALIVVAHSSSWSLAELVRYGFQGRRLEPG